MTAAPDTESIDDGFDPIIHPPNRLRICAVLDRSGEFEFGAIRDLVGVSDSVLSKQLAVLMEAGYVKQRRAIRETRQRVWLSMTPAGQRAFRGHVAALQAIVGSMNDAVAATPPA